MVRNIVVLFAVVVAAITLSAQTFEEKIQASEPLAPTPTEQNVAGRKYAAELCRIEGVEFLGTSNMRLMKAIEVIGDRVYVADESGGVRAFNVKGGKSCTLVPDQTFGDDGVFTPDRKIEYLSADSSGILYASTGIYGVYALKDGVVQYQCPKHYVEIHPSGTWGLSFWSNASSGLVTVEGTRCQRADWVMTDLGNNDKRMGPFSNISSVGFLDDLALVGGVVAEKPSPRIVLAMTRDGVEKFRFGNESPGFADDRFGWIHAIRPCKAGICTLDSNGRDMKLWTAEGGFLGNLELDKLFGLEYPWIPDFTIGSDGAAWFVTAQDRGKSGVAEGLVYRVNGL